MRTALIALIALVPVGLVVSELAVPGIAERRISDRLTAGGGSADVSIGAFPALRLLLEDGSHLEVEARGLEIDIDAEANALDRLDGFDRVRIAIEDFTAGPFALESFDLYRSGEEPYSLNVRGDASPADVVDYGADRLGIPGGGLLGPITGQALGPVPIPFALDMELESDRGRIRVVSGGGTIAGIPGGPLAELIITAVVERL